MHRTDDALLVRMAVPGASQDDIEVDVDGRTLNVRVARPAREIPGQRTRRERPLGDVTRAVDLPPEIDTTRIHATYQHGVLEIALPLEARRRIEIKTS